MVLIYLEEGRQQINTRCGGLEPWQVIGATIISTLGAVWLKGFLFQNESNILHKTSLQCAGERGDRCFGPSFLR